MELFCIKSSHDTYLITAPETGRLHHATLGENALIEPIVKILFRPDADSDAVFLRGDNQLGCFVPHSSSIVVNCKSLRVIHLENSQCAFLDEKTGFFLTAIPPQHGSSSNDIGIYSRHLRAWETFSLERFTGDVELSQQVRSQALRLMEPAGRITQENGTKSPLEAAFEENIEALTLSRGHHIETFKPIQLPIELDDIAKAREPWSFLKKVNFHLMKSISPSKTAAVVTSIKNEGIYIVEWVAHCLAVGFEHVFIYTNGNTDASLPLLRELAKNKYVTLIENEVHVDVSPQIKCFEHSIHLLNDLRAYKWVAYFDCDEFLIPAEKYDYSVTEMIKDLERHWPTRGPSAICIHWDWYGSNDEIYRRSGLVQERFQYRRPHHLVKSIVRLSDITTMWPIHFPDPGKAFFVNSAMKQIHVDNPHVLPVELSGAKLNHYFQKSFEEFGVKSHRGYGIWGEGTNGRQVVSFFEDDATEARGNGSFVPTPPRLLNRVRSLMSDLMSSPTMQAATAVCEARHREISLEFFGGDIEGAHRHFASKATR